MVLTEVRVMETHRNVAVDHPDGDRPTDGTPGTGSRVEASSGRMPMGVYLLAFSLFAMGSAEFLLAGVLPRSPTTWTSRCRPRAR